MAKKQSLVFHIVHVSEKATLILRWGKGNGEETNIRYVLFSMYIIFSHCLNKLTEIQKHVISVVKIFLPKGTNKVT